MPSLLRFILSFFARYLGFRIFLDIWVFGDSTFPAKKKKPFVKGSAGAHEARVQKFRVYLPKTAWTLDSEGILGLYAWTSGYQRYIILSLLHRCSPRYFWRAILETAVRVLTDSTWRFATAHVLRVLAVYAIVRHCPYCDYSSISDYVRVHCLELRVFRGSILRVLLPIFAIILENTAGIDSILALRAVEQCLYNKHLGLLTIHIPGIYFPGTITAFFLLYCSSSSSKSYLASSLLHTDAQQGIFGAEYWR